MLADVYTAAAAAIAGVTHKLGAEALRDAGAMPPRIVWVPSNDSFRYLTPTRRDYGTPRSIATRSAGLRLHVWGGTRGGSTVDNVRATEALVHQALAVLHDLFTGIVQPTVGEWMGQDGLGQEVSQLGRGYTLNVTVQVPVTYAANEDTTLATLTSEAIDSGLTGLDSPPADTPQPLITAP